MPRAARVVTRVRTAEFVGAVGAAGQKPPLDLPQIAIAGRSNVGKSSLLNRLVGRKSLARTSKRPGRTQEINFFLIDDRYLLVDLPGYGFARAPKTVREGWRRLIDAYLRGTPRLPGLVLLVDARRGLTEDDHRMIEFLEAMGTPTLFALTKTDKLNRSGRQRAAKSLRDALGLDADQLVETSAYTGAGVDTLVESITALVAQTETR
ncbi:ribosome biogenesis GTP-binding protein YihA/YsxC [Candidatus Palauibacter sp.]|uniref:ribosome biogenesis GTP-binding protein YihA/YsxC n=1 Tax=Candidatus Palauibacter sp. TaxID=3101350 RepID=UPI003CC63C3E